ncbi:hypothetical protein DFH06DRAFT_1341090 [Mycena polygramma]|nr:hypothetical protein DFH06DRAFT_1341090 [Mycena polygramma]
MPEAVVVWAAAAAKPAEASGPSQLRESSSKTLLLLSELGPEDSLRELRELELRLWEGEAHEALYELSARVQVQGPERAGHPRYQPLPYKARCDREPQQARCSNLPGVVQGNVDPGGAAEEVDDVGQMLEAVFRKPGTKPQKEIHKVRNKRKLAARGISWIWLADGSAADADQFRLLMSIRVSAINAVADRTPSPHRTPRRRTCRARASRCVLSARLATPATQRAGFQPLHTVPTTSGKLPPASALTGGFFRGRALPMWPPLRLSALQPRSRVAASRFPSCFGLHGCPPTSQSPYQARAPCSSPALCPSFLTAWAGRAARPRRYYFLFVRCGVFRPGAKRKRFATAITKPPAPSAAFPPKPAVVLCLESRGTSTSPAAVPRLFRPPSFFLAVFAYDERAPDPGRVRPAFQLPNGASFALFCCSTHAHFGAQILRLVAAQAVHPAKREGAGDVYLHANVRKLDVLLWRAQIINDAEFARRIALKAGHTNRMPRRQRQYAKCERGGRIIVWLGRYRVQRRCFVERLLHLRVFQSGGRRFRFRCACRVGHREYVSLSSAGGFAAFRLRAAAALANAGEGVHYRRFPRPAAVLSQDVYDFVVSS